MTELLPKQEMPTEKSCLSLANRLMNEVTHSLPEVKCLQDIDCNLIVLLYQEITGNIVPDLLACEDKVEEAHNVQAVIDALSLDALGVSLSHITGEEIVAGNVNSIYNLLQILEGVLLYLPIQGNGQIRILKRKICKIQKENSLSNFSKKLHLIGNRKPLKKSPLSPCHKSFLLPHSLRHKTNTLTSLKRTNSKNSNYIPHQISTKSKKDEPEILISQKKVPRNFIDVLCSEFPGIHIPPKSRKQFNEKYEKHLLKMQNQVKKCLLRKPKTIIQAEETVKRQQILSNIAKKEQHKQLHLKHLKEQKNHENKMKYRLRDSRLRAVQMKQYHNEYHEEMKNKLQKQSFLKEMIFDRVFKEIVNIQKYHVDDLCKQKNESENEDAENYLNYLTSLENLYHTQFLMLSDMLTNEKKDMQVKMDAEKKVTDKKYREFQEVLKQEIRFMQKVIVDLSDDPHFIEMDAEQFIERMRQHHMKC